MWYFECLTKHQESCAYITLQTDWSPNPPTLSQLLCYHSFLAVPFQPHSQSLLPRLASKCWCFPEHLPQHTALTAQVTSSTPLASITSYYAPPGSQVISWMPAQAFSCLWESTAWLSLGHIKPRMPIMNSSSFSQQPYSPLTFSISMKGRVSTK